MQIILNKEEMLEVLFSSLANGGLIELGQCGLDMVLEEDYQNAKARLVKANPDKSLCYEDVMIEILRNGEPLRFYDSEGEEEVEFTLEQAMKNLSSEDYMELVMTTKNEEDDAWTGFELLQVAIYNEIIYG
jgi:hypothetical protein